MRRGLPATVLAVALLFLASMPARSAETDHLAFVSEYVRELGINEQLRELGEKELAEPNANTSAVIIRHSTRIIYELTAQISMMRGMTLNKPFDDLPQTIAEFYEQKIQAHRQFIEIASAMIFGPKPGVDYAAIAVDMPKLIARLECVQWQT